MSCPWDRYFDHHDNQKNNSTNDFCIFNKWKIHSKLRSELIINHFQYLFNFDESSSDTTIIPFIF
jgi:hypothetical protein